MMRLETELWEEGEGLFSKFLPRHLKINLTPLVKVIYLWKL
jgi:hypothetical protein